MNALRSKAAAKASTTPAAAQVVTMAEAIAIGAAAVCGQIDSLIGAGNEDGDHLAAMRLQVVRMGMLADTLSRAHGGSVWGNGVDWLLRNDALSEAFFSLQPAKEG